MRVNLNYFISEVVFEFILEAVHLIAQQGWRLLPHYDFDPHSGLWVHRMGVAEPPMSLDSLEYRDGRLTYELHRSTEPESVLADYLKYARYIFDQAAIAADEQPAPLEVSPDFEHLRWFPLPHEIHPR